MQFLAVGAIAGILSGLFGIGGGIVIVPALLLVAKMKPETAIGTSLAALLLPVGALGALSYYRAGALRFGPALWIALGLFLGAWAGARLALDVSPSTLQRLFAVFLVIIAAQLWWTAG